MFVLDIGKEVEEVLLLRVGRPVAQGSIKRGPVCLKLHRDPDRVRRDWKAKRRSRRASPAYCPKMLRTFVFFTCRGSRFGPLALSARRRAAPSGVVVILKEHCLPQGVVRVVEVKLCSVASFFKPVPVNQSSQAISFSSFGLSLCLQSPWPFLRSRFVSLNNLVFGGWSFSLSAIFRSPAIFHVRASFVSWKTRTEAVTEFPGFCTKHPASELRRVLQRLGAESRGNSSCPVISAAILLKIRETIFTPLGVFNFQYLE